MAAEMSDPVQKYDALRRNNKFIFVVFYRGSWCPFCQAYLKELQALEPSIKSADGHVVTVTSENASELPKMRKASGYTGDAIVDPENLLAMELKRRGIVDVAISEHKGYPHGMVQPAVLIGGEGVQGVLFKWAIVPAMMNLGGAKDRPVLSQVWENAEAQIQGKETVHKTVSTRGFGFGIRQAIFG